MPKAATLDDLRRYAVARTLFKPTTLARAFDKLGFVQADPIRAPARAQDLILRHRVAGYRAGDLERRYARLKIDEDAFVNYGFLPRRHLALLHPRTPRRGWDAATEQKAAEVLAFVRARGPTHPRAVDAHFAHGRVTNYWGGSSSATTHLLDAMHYRGLLRVQRRDSGTRIYEAVDRAVADDSPAARATRAAALLDLVVAKYAPLPAASLVYLARLLGHGAPQLAAETRHALAALRERLASTRIDGVTWFWPADENPRSRSATRPTSASACSRRSIRSSGTGVASPCSGTGRTGSRRTRRRPGERSATTRCRCSGATGSSAGPTRQCATVGCAWQRASSTVRRASRRSGASSPTSARGWPSFSACDAGRRQAWLTARSSAFSSSSFRRGPSSVQRSACVSAVRKRAITGFSSSLTCVSS
jgi:uncharacterized protein